MKRWAPRCVALPAAVFLGIPSGRDAVAADHFLVVAGGYRAASNQVSLEKNVRFFREVHMDVAPLSGLSVYFANGDEDGRVVQFEAPDATVPKANELMARLFGSTRYLKLSYRSHELGRVNGMTSTANLASWFDTKGRKMKDGDRLFIYATAHGGKSREKPKPHNTTLYLWNQQFIDVKGLQKQMAKLPEGVTVILVMAQCYAGGFAHSVFQDTDPKSGSLERPLCGFFATVHSREAAGCTPEINEENYDEFSSHFWAAIRGKDRLGREIESADYNEDGVVSLDEAHAYTTLVSRNIDIPMKTSGAFLRERSLYGDDKEAKGNDRLLEKKTSYARVLELANASQRRVLEGLSEHLGLEGDDRYAKAEARSAELEKKRAALLKQFNEAKKTYDGHRNAIRNDLYGKWPELSNLLTEESVRLVSEGDEEFVAAVEGHERFQGWNEVEKSRKELADERFELELEWVQFIRFLRAHNNVVLAENLRHLDRPKDLERFRLIRDAEQGAMSMSVSPVKDGDGPVSGAE